MQTRKGSDLTRIPLSQAPGKHAPDAGSPCGKSWAHRAYPGISVLYHPSNRTETRFLPAVVRKDRRNGPFPQFSRTSPVSSGSLPFFHKKRREFPSFFVSPASHAFRLASFVAAAASAGALPMPSLLRPAYHIKDGSGHGHPYDEQLNIHTRSPFFFRAPRQGAPFPVSRNSRRSQDMYIEFHCQEQNSFSSRVSSPSPAFSHDKKGKVSLPLQ